MPPFWTHPWQTYFEYYSKILQTDSLSSHYVLNFDGAVYGYTLATMFASIRYFWGYRPMGNIMLVKRIFSLCFPQRALIFVHWKLNNSVY